MKIKIWMMFLLLCFCGLLNAEDEKILEKLEQHLINIALSKINEWDFTPIKKLGKKAVEPLFVIIGSKYQFREEILRKNNRLATKVKHFATRSVYEFADILYKDKKLTDKVIKAFNKLGDEEGEHQISLNIVRSLIDSFFAREKEIASLEKKVKARPKDFLMQYKLSMLFFKQKKYAQSIHHMKIALDGDPVGYAYYGLARAYYQIKEYEKALDAIEKAIDNGFNNISFFDGHSFKDLQKLPRYIKIVRKTIK